MEGDPPTTRAEIPIPNGVPVFQLDLLDNGVECESWSSSLPSQRSSRWSNHASLSDVVNLQSTKSTIGWPDERSDRGRDRDRMVGPYGTQMEHVL